MTKVLFVEALSSWVKSLVLAKVGGSAQLRIGTSARRFS
jgi:hypothetical protein